MKEEWGRLEITTASWLKGLAVLVAAYLLFLVHELVLVIIASIVIASAVEPAAVWARKRNIPRLPTVLSVYIVAAVLLAGLFYFLFLPLLSETIDLAQDLPIYSEIISQGTLLSGFGQAQDTPFGNLSGSIPFDEISNQLNSLVGSLSRGVFSSISAIFGGVLSFILIVVLSFYLAVQEDGIGKFLKAITPLHHEKYLVSLWRRSQTKIGLWMQGQLLLAIIVMVLVYLGLLLIGVSHPLLLAVLAGLFEIIPLFGPILAAIPALFIAFATDGMSTTLVVAGLYLIIQQFENNLIYPLVVKKVVGVPPMISILALLIGAQLAGFIGVLISVPVAAVAMELLEDIERRKQARLSEGEPVS